ncbi:MAG: phage tail tube protein [Pseudomonadota bacterium]
MPLQFGRSAFIKYEQESTYGTAVTTSISNRVTSVSLGRSQERERTTHLSQSDAAFAELTFDAFEQAGGSIEMPLFYKGMGQLFRCAIGGTPVTTGAGPYTHVFEPTTELPSLTVDFQRGTGSLEKFEGVMVSAMTISCEAGAEASASFEVIAETASTRTTAITPSFGSGAQVFHHQAGSLSFNSNTYIVRSFEFTIDNKLERVNNLGSKLTGQPQISDVREVTITATLDLEDNNLYNSQLAGDQSDVELTFTGGADSLTFLLRNAKITEYSDDVTSFGRIERTVTFFGLADLSVPETAFKLTMVNDAANATSN